MENKGIYKGKGLMWLWIAVGVVVVVAAALLYVFVFMGNNAPVTAAEKQIALLAEGKTSDVYNACDPGLKSATTLEQFTQFVTLYPVLSQNKSVSFTEKKISSTKADLFGNIEAKDGTKKLVHMLLVLSGTDWLINGIEILPEGMTRPTPSF